MPTPIQSDKAMMENYEGINPTRSTSIMPSAAPATTNNNNHRPNSLEHQSPPPHHLSEFFNIINKRSNSIASSQEQPPPNSADRQSSLNTFTLFTPSVLDLGPNIITSRDFKHLISTYENLLSKSTNFQVQLENLSQAANEFGRALEECIVDCPKVQNPKVVEDGILNAAGLQYMIGSNQQILSRIIQSNFIDPMQDKLNELISEYTENSTYYQTEIKQKTRELRRQELENLKISKQKTRNINQYKSNLTNLSNQLDDIDRIKHDYYQELNSVLSRFNQDSLLPKTGGLVRAQLEISESIARKGWSGGGLDDLLSISPDFFESSQTGFQDCALDMTDRLDDETDSGIGDETILMVDTDRAEGHNRNITDDSKEVMVDHSRNGSFSLPVIGSPNSLTRSHGPKPEENIIEDESRLPNDV